MQTAASLIARRQCSGNDAKSLINFAVKENSTNDLLSQKKADASEKKKKQLQSHQYRHRRILLDIKKNQDDDALKKQERMREQRKMKEKMKLKNYGHIKSKVFYSRGVSSTSTLATATTSSTVTSMDSISSHSSIRTIDKTVHHQHELCSKDMKNISEKHRSFGRVPRYILERRVAAEQEMRERGKHATHIAVSTPKICNANDYLERPPQVQGLVRMKESERKIAMKKLVETEKCLRLALMKFPFSLQNAGSIEKRKILEQQLNEIEDAKKNILLRA